MLLTPSTIGAIQQDPLRRIFKQASLDLQFAERKSLVDATTGQNLVDFTRASSATYVGSDGLIKTATTNLLLQSEDFSTTWTASNLLAFGSGSTINAIAAPNGLLAADQLTENTAASAVHNVTQSANFTSGVAYTVSVYAKTAGRNIRIGLPVAAFGAAISATFDLTTGSLTTTANSPSSTSISAFPDGWFRLSITATATTTASAAPSFNLISGPNAIVYTGDGTSGLFLWGAQLEQSSSVGEYIPTTSTINSAPRFDHNPTTGESLGLLVEEQRTNLIPYSEDFGDASWNNSGTLITGNTGQAPSGANTADTLISDTLSLFRTFASSAQTYTASIFVKQINAGSIILSLQGGLAGLSGGVLFDFSTNTASTSGTGATISSQTFGGGWYRIIATLTATGVASPQFRVQAAGGGSCFIWGAQLEADAFPTSYIPTTSSTVTRSADVASISGSNFDGWYRQDEGCVFAEWTATGSNLFASVYQFHNNAATTNLLEVYRNNSDTAIAARIREASGTQQTIAFASQNWLRVGNKIATSYAVNDYAGSINGGTILSDSSLNLPAPSVLAFGATQEGAANKYLSGTIRRLAYWPTRLPDSTLQTLTQ
jgi:hypothetical protein